MLDNRLETRDVRQDAACDHGKDHDAQYGHDLEPGRQTTAPEEREDGQRQREHCRTDLARAHSVATIVTSAPGITAAARSASARSANTPNTVGPEPLTSAPSAPVRRTLSSVSASSGRSDSAAS